ncbi:MAG TPA: penicillin-binding protein activator [Alphaproteobacteria bacterium]|nr:penicillin-binding protein activator [Alphaproteobacteria bacterium]
MWFRREVWVRRCPCIAAVVAVAFAGLLSACHDMSPRDYYIFGQPQASRPATQAPQQLPLTGPQPETAPPGAPLEPVVPEGTLPPVTAPAARPVVALLLPLSGPNAGLGRALLDAASLATFDIGGDSFVLLPRDTAGTPEGAASAAQSAIAAGARMIVGPLFAAEVPAVAGVARPANVNIVSLSNDRTVAGPGVFVIGLSPQGQIERVVGFAASRGLHSFAALVPNNSFGSVVEDAFRRSIQATGSNIALIDHYDPGADATPVVRRLAGYAGRVANAPSSRGGFQEGDDDAARDQSQPATAPVAAGSGGLDAVLLPDFGDRLLSIAPLLPYYDVDPAQVRFLGTALWEDPRVTREPALNGGWFAAPPPAARADFVKRYQGVYGQAPPRLATLAYDATALAAVLARGPNGPDFSAEAIGNPNGYAGTDGIFRFRSDGTAERGLAVLEVQRDGFKVISPAAEDFRDITR